MEKVEHECVLHLPFNCIVTVKQEKGRRVGKRGMCEIPLRMKKCAGEM